MAIEVILIVEQTHFNEKDVENFISMISDINTGVLIKNVGRNSTCPNHVSLVGFGIKTDSTRNFARTIGLSIQDLDNATNVQLRKWLSGLGAFDAYQAMKFALDNVLLRPSSTPACKRSRHMILLTGADRKVESSETAYITKQHLIDRLLTEDIELHTVINSRFRIPDVDDILGRAGSVGYSQSQAADTCVEIHRKVENGAAYGQTNHDFTELALAVNGTAWDVYQLHSEPRRQAMACVLAAVTTSALIQPGEYCRTCICDDYGNFQCSREASSNPGQCYCEYARGTVSYTQYAVCVCIATNTCLHHSNVHMMSIAHYFSRRIHTSTCKSAFIMRGILLTFIVFILSILGSEKCNRHSLYS